METSRFQCHRSKANSYVVECAVRWKSTFQYVRMSFCPENVGNWSSSPQSESDLSPRYIQSCFPLLQEPSCRKIAVSTFPIHLGQILLQSLIGSKKCDGDFLQPLTRVTFRLWIATPKRDYTDKLLYHQALFPATGPLEKRETALDRSWRKLHVILRRRRLISNIFGAKAHANVLKGTFSTDCKSNCIIIAS